MGEKGWPYFVEGPASLQSLQQKTGLSQGGMAQLGRRVGERKSAGGLLNLGLKFTFKRDIWNTWQQVT